MSLAVAPFLSLLKEIHRRHQERRRFIQTMRIVESLPHDLQKDLNWPDRYWEQQDCGTAEGK